MGGLQRRQQSSWCTLSQLMLSARLPSPQSHLLPSLLDSLQRVPPARGYGNPPPKALEINQVSLRFFYFYTVLGWHWIIKFQSYFPFMQARSNDVCHKVSIWNVNLIVHLSTLNWPQKIIFPQTQSVANQCYRQNSPYSAVQDLSQKWNSAQTHLPQPTGKIRTRLIYIPVLHHPQTPGWRIMIPHH